VSQNRCSLGSLSVATGRQLVTDSGRSFVNGPGLVTDSGRSFVNGSGLVTDTGHDTHITDSLHLDLLLRLLFPDKSLLLTLDICFLLTNQSTLDAHTSRCGCNYANTHSSTHEHSHPIPHMCECECVCDYTSFSYRSQPVVVILILIHRCKLLGLARTVRIHRIRPYFW